ncbi:MAG TPA: hypothetical protein VNO30_34525 [Kofleriaceae bacterium]|nr:hypothetical protein [Kofleriaceae bacterium]
MRAWLAATPALVLALALALVAAALVSGCFYEEQSPLPEDFGACTGPAPPGAEGGGAAEPTWYRDVEPIVDAKCRGCHTAGGVAPFALEDHTQIAGMREIVRDAVESRRMPPWQPAPCCNEYLHDRSLTDAERETLLRWLAGGTPAGDPADARPDAAPTPGLPRVDLAAVMPVPFTPAPKIGSDEIRCFLLDHEPIDRMRYITGFDFKPGARSLVHHVIVYAVDEDAARELAARDGADGRPGWDCYGEGGELVQSKQYIGGWQPGNLPRVLPEGLGRELPARTRLVVNIHYDTGHGTAPDRSAIDLTLADRVDRLERGIPVGNPLWFAGEGMQIDAGDPDAWVWFAYDPSEAVTAGRAALLHNVMLHMHELGTVGRVAILRASGETECLLNITDWDFHWMSDYYFARPVRLDPGDKLYVECRWDNSAGNQRIVNGAREAPRDLIWRTDDEMCGAVLLYSEAVTP